MDDKQTAMDTGDEHNMPDKLISTSILSYNEITSSSKRVLLDTSVERVNLKKIKLFDNSNEKQVTSLNTKENHVNLIIKKTPDQISKTTENNSEEHSNVFNEMRTDSNSEKNNSIYDKDSSIFNKVHNIGVDNLKTNHGENINEQDVIITEEELSDSNSSYKSCELEYIKTIKREFVQNNSNIYENKLLSDNLVTVEKLDHIKEEYIDENSLLTEIPSNEENAKDLEEIVKIENKKTDDILFTKLSTHQNDIQSRTESADVIKIIKCEDKNDEDHNDDTVVQKIDNDFINNGNDVGTTEKDNTSDIEDNAKIDHILKCCKEITKANFPMLMKLFSNKNMEFEHFEAACSKIISLYMAKKIKEKINKKINEILDLEKYWHDKFMSLSQQINDHIDLQKLPKEKLKIDSNAEPHQIIRRSVGIQVDMFKTDQKYRLRVSKVEKPCQNPQKTLLNDMFKLENDGGYVNETIDTNDTNNNDVNDDVIVIDDDGDGDDSTIIDNNVGHMITNNNVQHDISNNNVGHMITNNNVQHDISNNNVEHIVDNDPILISDDDDDDNENIVIINTQPSTLNTMENRISKKQLPESNMTEESSDFLTTTISNFQNLPEISLRSINNYPDIIDLTEDDDDSNNENRIVLQNRTAIDQNLYTRPLISRGEPFLYDGKLLTAQLLPNNSDQHQQQSSAALQNVNTKFMKFITSANGTIPHTAPHTAYTTAQLLSNNSGQHQQQSSGALQNVPMKFIRIITPANGTKKFVQIRAVPNCPQQFLESSAPSSSSQQFLELSAPPSGPQQFLELSDPPSGPQQFLELSAPPSGPQQFLEFSAPPGGPQQYVKSNARQTGPRPRSNVSQICQPSTSAAVVQLPSLSQTRTPPRPRPIMIKHPAPLPITKNRKSHGSWKKLPGAPEMHVPFRVVSEGFIIKWNVPMCPNTAQIRSFQFYIYDEALSSVPSTENWVEIGEVKALSLPMACSFSLVKPSTRYYLSMRAVDVYGRFSPFCAPRTLNFC